jgi:hypothetical protein
VPLNEGDDKYPLTVVETTLGDAVIRLLAPRCGQCNPRRFLFSNDSRGCLRVAHASTETQNQGDGRFTMPTPDTESVFIATSCPETRPSACPLRLRSTLPGVLDETNGLAQTQAAGTAVDVALGSTTVPVTREQSLISIAAISSPEKTQKWRMSSNEAARPW